jgi:hypothetical protein
MRDLVRLRTVRGRISWVAMGLGGVCVSGGDDVLAIQAQRY